MASARKLAYTNYFMTVGLLWFNAMLHCRMIALADFKNIYTVEKIRVVSVKNNAGMHERFDPRDHIKMFK